MKKITEEWLKFAYTDLLSCEKIVDDKLLTNIVAFHSQQAIEKSFKAIIEEFELSFEKIHDLKKLFQIVKDYIKFDIDIEILQDINKLYTDGRYPGELGLLPNGKPTINEAKRFYEFAKKIYENIKGTSINSFLSRNKYNE